MGIILSLNNLKPKEEQELYIDQYEEMENNLKLLENSVKVTKDELRMMKKEREKEK